MSVALVTGAGRGIGRATAIAFAKRGYDVALVSRSQDELGETRALVAHEGHRALTIACDVASSAAVSDARARVEKDLGAPSIVVCAAGIVKRVNVVDMTDEDFRAIMSVNLDGVFHFARAFVPAMISRKNGRFIAISSISATLGSKMQSAYAASKWGVDGFIKSFAEELRGTGVQAMSVRPGAVDTKMLEGSPFAAQMSADDVAKLVVFAALDAPAAMNGSAVEMFGP